MSDEAATRGAPEPGTPGRARSFGVIARAYHRHRPGYPAAALDWSLAPLTMPEHPVAGATLLDLGAGTGKLTAALVGRAAKVVAVEPDPVMLGVLRATLPGVTALEGSAERIPLEGASVDAVLVGQAFHWFDPGPATAEIVRVLRPGGVFAALWNAEDLGVEWVRGFYQAVGREQPPDRHGHLARAADPARPAEHPGLGPVASEVFPNPLPATAADMLDTLATYSWISTLPSAERAARLAAGQAYLAGRPETADGRFEVPLRTTVLRAVRR